MSDSDLLSALRAAVISIENAVTMLQWVKDERARAEAEFAFETAVAEFQRGRALCERRGLIETG